MQFGCSNKASGRMMYDTSSCIVEIVAIILIRYG